ncbi:pyruvate kinase [Sulfurovum sp. NBC37-1]|uniref:pyruvate kinase n=1 Tax=Sulfurovum sp. (strain NBC37-1) TaxID=387093 RepID=UPI00015878A3|nr:pyruvate kinase [Sulfurovum sp. NBC37-1]BAF71396.1 pyruvate kinase [Sulfurovum sp. NBC37-1]
MKKRTKIIATIGPATDSYEKIKALMCAGVNLFRLNFSHGTHEYHSEVLGRIRKAIEETGLITGILQDISGPKIRVGMLEEDFILKSGDILEFVKEEIVGYKVKEGVYRLCINEPDILDQLEVGESIYMYDGIIRAVVKEKSADMVKVEIENNGMLSSRKGVNFPNTHLGINVLTEKDKKDILWGIKHEVDFMAISFVQHQKDMTAAREVITSNGGSVQLLAKIEKFDAIENIDAILEASDGIMVARGDLGIEIPYYDVPLIQKMLIKRANNMSKPVIVATQMLLSMTTKVTASRAEISDVANAVLDGADAVMLSEESAIGHYPIRAVETMVQTIQSAERYYPFQKFSQFDMHDRGDKIDEAAVRLSGSLNCAGIIAMTSSGGTAKKAARYRPSQPIYAVTHDKRTAQSLTLVWGVVPAFFVAKSDLRSMIVEVMVQGLKRGILDLDDTYILITGDPVGVPGSTNLIRVVTRYEMEFFSSLRKEKEWID